MRAKVNYKFYLPQAFFHYFGSILNYNSEIWQLPTIKASLKQTLLSASAKALRVCIGFVDNNLSFLNLHNLCSKATPGMIMNYKLALCLYKLYNVEFDPFEFAVLNFNLILTGRQTEFITLKSNSFKVGVNLLANRLFLINNKIPLSWLNMSMNTFKIICKRLFLTMQK